MHGRDLNDVRRSDVRQSRLFRSLDRDNDGEVDSRSLRSSLESIGLLPDDPRLRETYESLAGRGSFTEGEFDRLAKRNILLLEQALQGRLVVPDFVRFTDSLRSIFEDVKRNRGGSPASYIPQLDFQGEAAERFGVGLCTIDGQRAAFSMRGVTI